MRSSTDPFGFEDDWKSMTFIEEWNNGCDTADKERAKWMKALQEKRAAARLQRQWKKRP